MSYNKERLMKFKARYEIADRDLYTIREIQNQNKAYIVGRLKNYFQIRLLLSDEDMDSENLEEIIERSLKKQEELLKAGVKLEDVLSPGCAGITGAAAKKIYLFLTIQNVLGVKMDEMRTPYIKTFDDLADTLLPLL